MDRIDTMRCFALVVSEGSFTRAAERMGFSPQLVSKYVSALEERLGVRLLNRTTRKVHLTEAGSGYYQRALQLLDELDALESQLGDWQQTAQGELRISAPVSFATRHLASLLCDFQKAHPAVGIDLQLNDRKIDIVEEGFDIALRIGQLKSSSLVAKRIAPVRLVTCAAPSYLAAHGTPRTVEDLKKHRYLRYSYLEDSRHSPLSDGLRGSASLGQGGVVSNNGDILSKIAIEGGGIVMQPTFIAGEAIAQGRLKVVLEQFEPEPLGLYVVYAHRKWLASKVRSFIEFIDGYFGEPPYWDDL